MSGKKRSEVQASLNAASRAADSARAALAQADAKALKKLRAAIADGLAQAESGAGTLVLPDFLTKEESVAARQAHKASTAALAEARQLKDATEQGIQQAEALDRQASRAFQDAQRQLDNAQRALLVKGSNDYLTPEWQLAEAAKRAFESAQRDAQLAQSARQRTQSLAQQAVEAATRAASSTRQAVGAIQATVAAATERKRREDEATRLAEEALRKATAAVTGAAAEVQSIPQADARKFQPAAFDVLQKKLATVETVLRRGDSAKASQVAAMVSGDARVLAAQVRDDRADFDCRRAEAIAVATRLESALAGADADLVHAWSNTPGAYSDAERALAKAREAIQREDFQTATTAAAGAVMALRAAMEAGVEGRAADERRSAIGQAIMEVLGEMHFDVSFDPGTRDEPMRISGQTADVTGRGDFDLAIPLNGQVDFEVTAEEGDSSCVAAVDQLREKLSERGIDWRTTDWGHTNGVAVEGNRTITRTTTRTQTKSKSVG
jgi:hypothetical protein